MQSIAAKLAGILQKVERPGDFYATGTAAVFPPQLEVEGVGVIALPLLDVQAEQLVAAAERAPYGRGAETVHDEKVRRTWQIDASRVRIGGRRWQESLNALVAEAAAGLGVAEPVAAEFYKLLVYGEGDFFVSHRDTEKCPGMFATLVIVLPSIYTGGELLVRHQGREVMLDMRCEDPSEAAFAAFYADCVHEVLPIASGRRLTLIYNLRRTAGGPLPEAPDYRGEQDELAQLLQWWAAGDGAQDALTEKLIYPLQHAYTPAELSFEALKGADAAAAAVLKGAAARSGCELHLALISIEESGIAEHTGYYGSRWGRSSDDEEEFEAVEVCDRSATLSHWLRADGAPTPLKKIPFDESEVCPPGSLDDMEPDEEHFHEATGNEGASFERTYQRAALAIWPEAQYLAVFNQAGLDVTLPYLEGLTARWEASGAQSGDAQWREADELCGYMLENWPVHRWHPQKDDASSKESRMLLLLARLKNRPRIEAFLGNVTAAGAFASADAEAAVQALCLLPEKAGELIERIIAGNAERALSACGRLLACSVARVASLTGAAASLVAALPPGAAKSPPPVWGEQPRPVEPGFAADLIAALDRIDPALAERAASHMLAWPKTFGFDAVLVPAVIELAVRSEGEESEAALRLRKACLDHLQARIGLVLEPPSDWSRSGVVSCSCQYCQELNAFLSDSGRRAWTFKAAEAKRRHLQEMIRQDRCDLDLATEKRGSPHGLVCTKNQASYERRARQRKADLENFDRLKSRKPEREH